MWALIGLFAGAFVGNLLWHDWGAALGGIAGFVAGAKLVARRAPPAIRQPEAAGLPPPAVPTAARGEGAALGSDGALLQRIADLERRVAILEQDANVGPDLAQETLAPSSTEMPATKLAAPTGATEEASATAAEPPGEIHAGTPPVDIRAAAPLGEIHAAAVSGEVRAAASPGEMHASDHVVPPVKARENPLWAWFTGGNALTRIGVVVLFFGVAFLLKYFALHFTVPIELRLAAVAAGGFALMGLGMRLAASRPGYGLSLQGAGAGILYLTTYAAFRLYGVLPEVPTIALLVAISALTVSLAVRNDSQPLAGLAIAGGFLSPMLVATGGEPIHLFGYFAVLNGAIFALAWTKAWRGLNALGFAFTFVLGAAWGHGFYRPEHFAVVQPFLVLFFVFYVTISILYARRGPIKAKDPVDGLLVFGVPLVGFALQAAIVRDARYGAAWSALAAAGIYALLHLALRKRGEPGFPLLSRAFGALAVIFATIAIPFALDNRWTAALWAIEAAGVYWIGVEQKARIARTFALFVEFGSGIVFVASGVGGGDDPLFANAFFAGAMLIAISGLVTARIADRSGDVLPAGERSLVPLLFGWGVVWWLAAGGVELVRQLPRADEVHAVLAWVTATVALALVLARRLSWPRLAGAGIALLPTMAIVALGDFNLARTTLAAYGWVVWPIAWFVHWRALRAADALPGNVPAQGQGSPHAGSWLYKAHAASALALTAQLSWEASEWTGRSTALRTAWTACAAALPAILFLWSCVRYRDSVRWPADPYRRAYAVGAGTPIAVLLAVWFFVVNALSPGDASPLPYLPAASPLDLTLALALWALAAWAARFTAIPEHVLFRWVGAGLFVALNGIVLRTAHHWADIPWRLTSLLASKPLQAALTLTWTATALALMVGATKRRLRPLWMLGAALLAAVVGKLFLVDLGALSGLPRVVAFLGVGILLLVIGFLSPLPPASQPGGSREVR
jgi:uncharacterized membrane protein